MHRAEIARSFDQIVDFAGVAKFIDTPVKRYSSGMSARLGFAIAAHLDPEVLVIDEVLAVGDAVFQRRAMDRVAELVRRQIPVVIVTHQLEQVGALCTKALVLEYGHVVAQGPPGECVSAYLERSLHRQILGAAAIAAKSVEAYGGTTVRSGDRLTFGVDVVVRDAAHVDEQQLALRVRAAMTGSVVYEAPLEAVAALPSRSEWFWLEPSLQFNVPPGPYYVEMCVRSRLDGRELVRGPGVYVDVTPSGVFDGPAQLNLACEVTHAEEYGRARRYAAPRASAGG
jgi:hypothetical protein